MASELCRCSLGLAVASSVHYLRCFRNLIYAALPGCGGGGGGGGGAVVHCAVDLLQRPDAHPADLNTPTHHIPDDVLQRHHRHRLRLRLCSWGLP